MVFTLVFASNTILSCFFFFLIIDLYFLIKKKKVEIETHPVTAEAGISKYSV